MKKLSDNIWKNLYWFNFLDLPARKSSTDSYELIRINSLLNNNNGIPFFVYMSNTKILELEQIIHPNLIRHFLNMTGVDVYLYEPLSSYKTTDPQFAPPLGTNMSLQFYGEFDADIFEDSSTLRAIELDSIAIYAKNNGLTDVRVHTCDYNVSKYYTEYPGLQLLTDDLFLRNFNIEEFEPVSDDDIFDEFNKKFINLNWRWTPHRQLITSYLTQSQSSYITWYFKISLENMYREVWYDLDKWKIEDEKLYNKIENGVQYINENSPLVIDLDIKEAITLDHYYSRRSIPPESIYSFKPQNEIGLRMDILKNVYLDSFCEIVSETRFAQPTANFSEKTLRAMYYKRPFVVVAPPNTLEYIKSLGFMTFDKWFDESYDTCTDPANRFKKIIEVIDSIEDTPIDTLRQYYNEMQEILNHNHKMICDYYKNN